MFCSKCGTKNLDDARFCCKCGNSLYAEPHSPPPFQSETIPSDIPTNQGVSPTARSKSKAPLIGGGILLVAIIATVAVFFIRASGENNLLSNVTSTIDDNSEEDVVAYYDQFLPVAYADGGYMRECHYDQFQLEKGNDGNTFLITGTLAVTDLLIEERPSYQIGISGTVKTNFFRSEYTVEWSYDFEEPEYRLTYQDIVGSYTDGPANEIYSSGISIDIYDETLEIFYGSYRGGMGTFMATFAPQDKWPKIENNSLYFAAEEQFWDYTYDITLTFVPASESSTGKDTIYLKGHEFFDDCVFVRDPE